MTSMLVAEISRPGPPEALRWVSRERPEPGPGEVLLRVRAFGINRPDVLQRKGLYPPPPGASDIPGLEVCGEVLGGDLQGSTLRTGQRVCALLTGGGYAEYCVAPVGQCLPVPEILSDAEAAALPETYFTVWHNVFERGALKAGELLMVQGGTSGIGTTAIQLAHAFGATVWATAGSDVKCQACLDLGAVRAINYRTQDFAEQVQEHTKGRGVDVLLDMVAGDYVARELGCMAEDGRLVIIAVQGGTAAGFDAALLMRRRLTITGSTLRARSVAFKSGVALALREKVWPQIEAGRVRPHVHAVLPAEQVAQAHALMEAGQHIGKIVLSWP